MKSMATTFYKKIATLTPGFLPRYELAGIKDYMWANGRCYLDMAEFHIWQNDWLMDF